MEKLTLTCTLKDGRVVKGTYPYLAAIARHEFALKQMNCKSAVLAEAE